MLDLSKQDSKAQTMQLTKAQLKALDTATEQTDENFKTGSLITLAKAFGTKQHRDAFKAMEALQIAIGYMPFELNTLREYWSFHLYNHVYQKYGYEIKERVRMCG